MISNFRIARFFGIEITAHWSWLLLAALITSSLAQGWFPQLVPGAPTSAYWISGIIGAIGLFASIVIHEFSHALVGRHFSIPIEKVSLFLFGGVAQMDDEPPSAKSEFFMALAGPLMSVVLAVAFWFCSTLTATEPTNLLTALFQYLASINIIVAVFNMIPAFPLDGGRILRAALWTRKKDIVSATKVAAGVGQGFGGLFIFIGIWRLFKADAFDGLWLSLLGLMIIAFARNAYSRVIIKQTLHDKTAQTFMDHSPETATRATCIADIVRGYIHSDQSNTLPVIDDDGNLAGIVDLQHARQFPESEWNQHAAQEIIEPCSENHLIDRDAHADQALMKMARYGFAELFVIDHGRLIGVLQRSTLIRYLSLSKI